MRQVLLWLWQLPQNIIGFAVSWFCTKDYRLIEGIWYWFYYREHFFRSAVSLGNYIIADKAYCDSNSLENMLMHERGHQAQSRYLGPLYLIAVGLPSLCGNVYDRIFHRNWERLRRELWYYSQPWEAWADRLGGVER